jgi:cellulose synthase (UDP-forming)
VAQVKDLFSAAGLSLDREKFMSQEKRPQLDYEPLGPGQQLVAGAFIICSLWYLSWRATTLNPDAYIFSWVVYGAELFGFLSALLHLFMIWRLTERQSPPAPTGKTVDVFIPTINESEAMVRQTLLAALHLDYPHETWLLDDGNRPEMAQLAQELGARYLARNNNDDAKAGNLNYALTHSSGEFIAIFDADHAPQRHFLERTLGYFADHRVAFVQTPQDFYNLDSYQHRRQGHGRRIWTEQSLFFRIIQRGKDYWNAAFFCGSCAVLRRSALQAIDGFATGTVTEDLHTSLRLHMQRFRSVYHAESLAFGLAPDTVSAFLGQRIRWGEGAMKVWRSEGLLFNRRLTLPQRLNYFASVLTYFDGWQKLVFYVAPAIVLLTGLLPIYTSVGTFLLHFIPYIVLTLWVFEESARGFGNFLQTEEYNMARFYAFARATLGWLGNGRKFQVTPKDVHGDITERGKIIPQYIVLAVNLLAIPLGYLFYLHYQWLPAGGMFANILWASANVWLAYSLVTFTTHKSHQRLDYRFDIPVPARICHQGKCHFGTIDDVSSSGFRLYARLADGTLSGECLSGELWLPGKRLPFTAEIKRLIPAHDSSGDYIKAYGCEFNWQDHARHDQLDRYLFGSGLQWQIQGLQESSRTPLQWLSDLRQGKQNSDDNAPPCWAVFVYHMPGSSGTDEMAGLIEVTRPGQTERKVLLYHPVNKGVLLNGRVITPLCEEDITLCATAVRQIETQLTPIFMITTEVFIRSVNAAEPVRIFGQATAHADNASQAADAAILHKRSLS